MMLFELVFSLQNSRCILNYLFCMSDKQESIDDKQAYTEKKIDEKKMDGI